MRTIGAVWNDGGPASAMGLPPSAGWALWDDFFGGPQAEPPLVAAKTADESVTSSVTLQDDNHLFIEDLEPYAYYDVVLRIAATGDPSGDLKLGWSGPASATMHWYFIRAVATGLGIGDTLPVGTNSAGINIETIHGVLYTGASGGTLQLRWAQNAIHGTPTTLLEGSILRLQRQRPSRAGDLRWRLRSIGSRSGATLPRVTPSALTEGGVLALTTGAASGDGAVLHLPGPSFSTSGLPVGSLFGAKLQMSSGTTSYTLWTGFTDSPTALPSAATDGIYIYSTGGNLTGRVYDGTTSTTVDFGFTAEAGFVVVGFEVRPGPKVQFFYLELDDRMAWVRRNVGDPISTGLPNEALYAIALGLATNTTAARTAQVDWWGLGGRVAR